MNNFLEKEDLGILMRRYALPCIISLLVGALYNIVDQIFIANASYLGSYGNAANTVVFPLTVVALAAAVCLGDGCSTFVSMSMGGGQKKRAEEALGTTLTLCVLTGLLFLALYLLFSNALLLFFGAGVNETTYRFSREYLFWIALGIPFYIFGQAVNPIIRADGDPRYAMAATLSGAVLNLILDPVMIYLLHWGMAGAAIATVLGQILTAVLSLRYLGHMRSLHFTLSQLKIRPQYLRSILPLGMTSFLSQISLVASMAAVNNMIGRYSALDPIFAQPQYTQIPMAVIGIVMKFFQIVISIVVGMAAGCAPIAAYNTGCGRKDRVSELFRKLLKYEFLVGLFALLIAEGMPEKLIALFGAANESTYYTEFAVRSFRTYLCFLPLAAVNKASFIYLQALGKAFLSTAISMIREVLFGVGLALLLPRFFALNGVLYSMPAADLLTFLIAVALILRVFRELRETTERSAANA